MGNVEKNIMVAIGIPAYNEENNIGILLENLLFQELSAPFKLEQIIVVASGCTDNTPQIVEFLGKKYRIINLICEEERKGKASALNIIFKQVKADIIVLMGADVLPKKGSLSKLISPFIDASVGAVSGHPIPINATKGLAGTASSLIWDLHDLFSREIDVKLSGEFFAVRRGLISKIYSKVNCDDAFIEFLVKEKNYKIRYVPEAVVKIKGPENFWDLLRQRRRIHAGHQQIKKITGKPVKTATMRDNLKLLIKIFQKYYRNKWFFPAIFVEILARLFGYIDSLKGNYHVIWERIDSTKNLVIQK
ncbi:MAG: glycosyltransferase [Candidatus Helarchaeota archaeon]